MSWITTKDGKHINTDWFDKEKQIADNKKEADDRNGNVVTMDDIKSKLISDNSYTKDKEYSQIKAEVDKAVKERQELSDRVHELRAQIDKETQIKPRDKWTTDDEINALLGARPVSYTEKGEQLKKEYDEVFKKYNEVDHKWSELSGNVRALDEKQSSIQKEQYTKDYQKYGDIKPATQDNYKGFDRAKTTTPYIDDMIKSGKATIVEMTPERYLREVAHKIFSNATIETALRGVSVASINKYMKMMKEGTKFNTPYLNYRDAQQEGRHRAIAAMMLGIKKMPVVIIRK